MTEPSIELSQAWDKAQEAISALALAVLRDYIAEVNHQAEADQLRGPLEGAHYRAMQKVARAHQERILALGKGDG